MFVSKLMTSLGFVGFLIWIRQTSVSILSLFYLKMVKDAAAAFGVILTPLRAGSCLRRYRSPPQARALPSWVYIGRVPKLEQPRLPHRATSRGYGSADSPFLPSFSAHPINPPQPLLQVSFDSKGQEERKEWAVPPPGLRGA